MSQVEAVQFEKDILFGKSLQVRKYDEMGKEPGLKIKVLSIFVLYVHLFMFRNLLITKRCFLPT